jgi:DNA repair exonuclease SbcCD ATPase subunit
MSWDQLGKTVNTFVEERLLSPLLATFVVSWAIWNYKFLVILFSLHSVQTTFKLIDALFPDVQTRFVWGFVLPMLTTLAYLYVYPWFAAIALEQWKKSQLKLTKIRRKYDDETPVSEAEAREIRTARYKAEEELEKARRDLADVRRDLIALRQDRTDRNSSTPDKDDQSAQAYANIEEARKDIKQLLADAGNRAQEIIEAAKGQATEEGRKIIEAARAEAQRAVEQAKVEEEEEEEEEEKEGRPPEEMMTVFGIFEKYDTNLLKKSDLFTALAQEGIGKVEATFRVKQMADWGYIDFPKEFQDGVAVTHKGLEDYYTAKKKIKRAAKTSRSEPTAR